MKTKTETDRLALITPAEWAALTPDEQRAACIRAQLQASNAELLLSQALDRIALALATLNPR